MGETPWTSSSNMDDFMHQLSNPPFSQLTPECEPETLWRELYRSTMDNHQWLCAYLLVPSSKSRPSLSPWTSSIFPSPSSPLTQSSPSILPSRPSCTEANSLVSLRAATARIDLSKETFDLEPIIFPLMGTLSTVSSLTSPLITWRAVLSPTIAFIVVELGSHASCKFTRFSSSLSSEGVESVRCSTDCLWSHKNWLDWNLLHKGPCCRKGYLTTPQKDHCQGSVSQSSVWSSYVIHVRQCSYSKSHLILVPLLFPPYPSPFMQTRVFILSSDCPPHLAYHSTFPQECEEDGSLTNGA